MTREHVVVSDEYRTEDSPRTQRARDLLAGKTVFIAGAKQTDFGGTYSYARRKHNKRLRTHRATIDGVAGTVVWFEDLT